MKCFSWHLDTAGIFAASVADVAFAAGAITGRDLGIGTQRCDAPRLGLVRTHVWDAASEPMRGALKLRPAPRNLLALGSGNYRCQNRCKRPSTPIR